MKDNHTLYLNDKKDSFRKFGFGVLKKMMHDIYIFFEE